MPTQQARSRIAGLLSQKRDYRQELKSLAGRRQYVVFYGAGTVLERIVASWDRSVGRKADYCCDSDPAKWGKYFCGLKCIPPAELLGMKDKCAVFVTAGNYTQVLDYLERGGVAGAKPLYKYDMAPAGPAGGDDPEGTARLLTEVYGLLADERSRQVFDAMVSRVLDPRAPQDVMAKVSSGDQYFPPGIVELSQHESFVDAGAFDGDSVREFVRRAHGRFDGIFSFELDAANFAALRESVGSMPERARIKVFNLGLWDGSGEISYGGENFDSAIGGGKAAGRAVPLDEVLKDEKVTFIKMDIEGAEPRALRGAAGLIRAQKPKLAVCVYHEFAHLWQVPLYIRELVPEYRIYLRHHTSLEYETVCYAVL